MGVQLQEQEKNQDPTKFPRERHKLQFETSISSRDGGGGTGKQRMIFITNTFRCSSTHCVA